MTVTGPLGYLLVIITLTTGSAFVMWLGERVTEKVLATVFLLSC